MLFAEVSLCTRQVPTAVLATGTDSMAVEFGGLRCRSNFRACSVGGIRVL